MKKSFALFYFIVLFIFLLLTTRCIKEYSYESGTSATFTLKGSPNACTETILNGNYYVGIATDTNSTIELMAHVISAGNFAITTNIADSISFSAGGNFADTGYQTITLKCTGTPTTAGVFTFTIPDSNGCSFSVEVTNQPPAQFILIGSPNDCNNPIIKGDYIDRQAFTNEDTVMLNVSVISTGSYTITTDTVNGVNFSASGNFTTTGNHKVTLKARGAVNGPGLYQFSLIGGSSTCSFSIPVLIGDPYAVYVLESGSSGTSVICTQFSVQGNYVSGKALNGSNVITTEVYVRDAGNYCVSTNTINGISFTGYGTFTTTGEQNIILYGTGIPLVSGTYMFTPQIIGPAPIGGASCDFSITVQ